MKRFFGLILALMLMLSLSAVACGEAVASCPGNCNHVAAIGTTHYDTTQAAVDAANAGDTITIIADHELDCSSELIVIDGADTEITIDLNNCVITADNTAGIAIDAIITVENEGKLTILDSSPEKTGGIFVTTATRPNVSCIFYNNNSVQPNDNPDYSLIIESGMYTMNDSASAVVYSSQSNTTLVTGGSFTLESVGTRSNGSPWIFNASGQNQRHVIVTGGTFNADINHQHYPFEVDVPKERALKNNGDGTRTIVDAVVYVTELEWSSNWYIHQVGYASIKDAVEGAEDNKTLATNREAGNKNGYEVEFDNKDTVAVTRKNDATKDFVTENFKVFNLITPVSLTVRENGVAATAIELNSITPAFPASVQYGYSTDGSFPAEWHDSALFTDLNSNTEYTFFARYVEEDAAIVVSEATIKTAPSYTNIFVGGDATGPAPAHIVPTDGKIVLPKNTFTKDGYRFVGWSDSVHTYQPGEEYTIPGNADVVFTALWEAVYTVSFNANGGTGTMTPAIVPVGEYTLPANSFTAPSGKQFKVWSVDGVEKAVGATITISTNTEISAIWKDAPSGGYYPVDTPEETPTETPEEKPAEAKPVEDPVTPPTEEEVVTPTPEDTTPVVPDEPVINEPVVDEPSVDDEPQQGSIAVWVVVGAVAVSAGAAAIIIGKKRNS